MSTISLPPLSNHVTAAATENGTPSVVLRSDGTPAGTTVKLTNGIGLGLVQSVSWDLSVTGYATCVITTLVTPAEFKALARDTEVLIRAAPGYHPLRYLWDWYATKAWLWWTRRNA